MADQDSHGNQVAKRKCFSGNVWQEGQTHIKFDWRINFIYIPIKETEPSSLGQEALQGVFAALFSLVLEFEKLKQASGLYFLVVFFS